MLSLNYNITSPCAILVLGFAAFRSLQRCHICAFDIVLQAALLYIQYRILPKKAKIFERSVQAKGFNSSF